MSDFDVISYCHKLSQSDVLSTRVIGWTGRWSMFGSFVLCCQCLNAQGVDEAGQPFEHQHDCTAKGLGLYPWQELKEVLADVRDPPVYISPS
jgi:hypothetical protein